jgi:tRNA dimethylallyltransferase
MGPTAGGKTALALTLAEQLPVSLVNVDSAQVYRGLNIGAGKPAADILTRFPHHLLDIRDPAEPYSAANFRADALDVIAEIHASRRIPLLVGGTMLYFKALRDGLADMPAADPGVRAGILDLATSQGWEAVHARLARVDPASAARIHPNDPQRLQRALEVFELTGISMSEYRRRQPQTSHLSFRLIEFALLPQERAFLHKAIEIRFRSMLDAGLVDEVARLRAREDLDPNLPAIRAVGYRQVWDYLDGHYDYDTMVAKAVAATRQLAKRQLTWLRSWPAVQTLNSQSPTLLEDTLGLLAIQGISPETAC